MAALGKFIRRFRVVSGRMEMTEFGQKRSSGSTGKISG
jgi:hypothetical protein